MSQISEIIINKIKNDLLNENNIQTLNKQFYLPIKNKLTQYIYPLIIFLYIFIILITILLLMSLSSLYTSINLNRLILQNMQL